MTTKRDYIGSLTVEDINKVAELFEVDENQLMHEKIQAVARQSILSDSFQRALALEWMRIGYLAAHCEKQDSPPIALGVVKNKEYLEKLYPKKEEKKTSPDELIKEYGDTF